MLLWVFLQILDINLSILPWFWGIFWWFWNCLCGEEDTWIIKRHPQALDGSTQWFFQCTQMLRPENRCDQHSRTEIDAKPYRTKLHLKLRTVKFLTIQNPSESSEPCLILNLYATGDRSHAVYDRNVVGDGIPVLCSQATQLLSPKSMQQWSTCPLCSGGTSPLLRTVGHCPVLQTGLRRLSTRCRSQPQKKKQDRGTVRHHGLRWTPTNMFQHDCFLCLLTVHSHFYIASNRNRIFALPESQTARLLDWVFAGCHGGSNEREFVGPQLRSWPSSVHTPDRFETVIDLCAFLFSSHVDTALFKWIRRRLESQVIRQTSRRPDSFLIGLCLLQGAPSQECLRWLLNHDFQPLKTVLKRDKAIPVYETVGILTLPTIPQLQLLRGTIQDTLHGWHQSLLNLAHHPTHAVLDLSCTRPIGSRTAIRRFQKYAMYHGITTEFCPCRKSFVFANSETETCWQSCDINSPTTPPCFTRVDVLDSGDVPILFSVPQMKILGMTVELDPKGDKITCRVLCL